MIPKRIVLENFLSFGEPAAEIAFDDGEPLWVISGPNGIGKSSVFDAITYALFGCHRDGKGQGMKDLVRHGANGFRVEFEFACGDHQYRVVRNYGRRAVEKVFRNGEEVSLPAGRNAVKEWAERELGLSYEQFTASVLLKQGEADKIITGTGADRLKMLKQIIGVEQYEGLSERVHCQRMTVDAKHDQLTDDLDRLPEVTIEERRCGLWVIDLRTGQTVAFLRFDAGVQEVFAVRVLPGIRFPELVDNPDDDITGESFILPAAAALRDVVVAG